MANWSNVDVEHDKGVKVISHERVEDTNPKTFDERGNAFFQAGKYAEAEKEYIKAYQLSGESDEYYKKLISFYRAIHNPKAEKMMKKYIWGKWGVVIWFAITSLFAITYLIDVDGIDTWRWSADIPCFLPLWVIGLLWFFCSGGIGKSINFKMFTYIISNILWIFFEIFFNQNRSLMKILLTCYAVAGVVFGIVFLVESIKILKFSNRKNIKIITKILLIVMGLFLSFCVSSDENAIVPGLYTIFVLVYCWKKIFGKKR